MSNVTPVSSSPIASVTFSSALTPDSEDEREMGASQDACAEELSSMMASKLVVSPVDLTSIFCETTR